MDKMQLGGLDPVGYEEGLAVARRIKAKRYLGKSCCAGVSYGSEVASVVGLQVGWVSHTRSSDR